MKCWNFETVCCRPAVRTGNLAKFNQVLEQFGEKFQTDGTYTLIIRLRHNVIKTGEPITGHSTWDITYCHVRLQP